MNILSLRTGGLHPDSLPLTPCIRRRSTICAHQGQDIELAGYDHRMTAAARAMEIPVHDLKAQATATPATGP